MKIISAKTLIRICAITYLFIFIQGCAKVVDRKVWQGSLVKEEPTGRRSVVVKRIPHIELLTPTSVFVYEDVQYGDEYRQFYNKIVEQTTIRLNPLYFGSFESDYCVKADADYHKRTTNYNDVCQKQTEKHIVKDEYIDDKGFRNLVTKKEIVSSGKVNVIINDGTRIDMATQSDGKVDVHLENYFDVLPDDEDTKLMFVFESESVASYVSWGVVKKGATAALQSYRKSGGENGSFRDYYMAYKISGLDSDYAKALSLAQSANEKEQLEKTYYYKAQRDDNIIAALKRYVKNYPSGLFVSGASDKIDFMEFDDAAKKGKFAEFIKQHPSSSHVSEAKAAIAKIEFNAFKNEACNGKIREMVDVFEDNPYETKGRCYKLYAVSRSDLFKVQLLSRTTALYLIRYSSYSVDSHGVFVDFGKDSVPSDWEGIVIGMGAKEYTSVMGAPTIVPSVKVIKLSK